jgi:hypothetical protein
MANEFVARNGLIAQNNSIITGSLIVTAGITGSFSGSIENALTASYAITASYAMNGGGNGFPFSGSAIITGSLLVSGSGITITGSLNSPNITGSLQGTSSWAVSSSQAISASRAVTSSYALTATVFPFTGSAIISGSFTVTGSTNINAGTGTTLLSTNADTLTITGSLITSGSSTTIGSQIVTGSFTVITGSSIELQVTNTGIKIGNAITDIHTLTGSVGITGSLTVNNSSVVTSNQTSSFVTNSQTSSMTVATASYVLNAVSSSYAATASYANNFTVAGTLTAQTIVVQTITSSIDYVTGSSRFGSTISNTHQFTGSVSVSGSLSLNENSVITSNQTSSFVQNSQTSSFVTNSQTSSFVTNNQTGSFATTGSNSFKASQTITGSLVVSGSSATIEVYGDKIIVGAIGGDEGGEILLGKPTTNSTLTGSGITIDSYQNKIRFFEQGGAARGAYIDISACDGGVGTNLLSGGGGTTFNGGTNVDNRIVTATGTSPELNGEANLTFNGSTLTVTGNVTASSFTGSLFGTSSQAISASFATISQTSSYATNFTVANTLTAQTIVVQTITSSTDFVTGSSRFGSLLSNTHQFTGSVSITGSLDVTGTGITGSLQGTSSWATNARTASSADAFTVRGNLIVSGSTTIGDATTDSITFNAVTMSLGSGTGVLNVDSNTLVVNGSTNRVGIGVASPAVRLDVTGGDTTINTAQFGTIGIQSYAVNNAWFGDNVYFNGTNFVRRVTGFAGLFYFQGSEGQFRWGTSSTAGSSITNGASGNGLVSLKTTVDGTLAVGDLSTTSGNYTGAKFLVSSSGNVGIGTINPIYKLDVSGSGNFTSGLTITGSLNAPSITGSLLGTASYAITASYAMNGGGGAAFPYTGSAVITGSLTVTGSIDYTGDIKQNGIIGVPHTASIGLSLSAASFVATTEGIYTIDGGDPTTYDFTFPDPTLVPYRKIIIANKSDTTRVAINATNKPLYQGTRSTYAKNIDSIPAVSTMEFVSDGTDWRSLPASSTPTFNSIDLSSASYDIYTPGVYRITNASSNNIRLPNPLQHEGTRITIINSDGSNAATFGGTYTPVDASDTGVTDVPLDTASEFVSINGYWYKV